jgi:hypothetical protein
MGVVRLVRGCRFGGGGVAGSVFCHRWFEIGVGFEWVVVCSWWFDWGLAVSLGIGGLVVLLVVQ